MTAGARDEPSVGEGVRTLLLLMPRLVSRAKRRPVPGVILTGPLIAPQRVFDDRRRSEE